MKKECNIIRDILPLYVEDIVSRDTGAFVEAHLSECSECRAEWERMKKPARFIADTDAAPLKKLKRKLSEKRMKTAAFTAALVSAVVLAVVSVLTSPNDFPYSENLISIVENSDDTVTLSFADDVTGYTVHRGTDSASGIEIYRVTAWNTDWDLHFTKRETQNMVVSTQGEIAIFYSPNDGTEDVFLYGADPYQDEGTVTLPRLVLGYYLFLALFAFLLSGGLWLVFRRNETVRGCLERALFLPVSYLAAHLLIKGFTIRSYSQQRDLGMIILAAIFIYCAVLLGISLCRAKKDT